MSLIQQEEVLTLFRENGNRLINSAGMEIIYLDNTVSTYLTVRSHDQGPLKVSISTEEESLFEFIDGFEIKSLSNIDELDYKNSWMRYLNGYAIMHIIPYELEAEISFRIHKCKTMIFSLDLHFYDEVHKHLTLPEDFENYIEKKEQSLYLANSKRYRFT